MVPVIRLDRPVRRRLQKLDRKTRDADTRVRCRVLIKVGRGMSCHAAAMEVGCVPSTAWRIVDRFVILGEASLLDGRSENGERKVDEDVRQGVREILLRRPPDFGFTRQTWSLALLTRVIAEEMGIELSPGHLWRVLRQMRVRWGRPKPVVACPWKAERRKKRIAYLRRLARRSTDEEPVVYADEVDIHLNPRIGPDWMLPGIQRIVVTPGKNEKRYIAGAYDPRTQRMVYVEGDRKASWLFLNLLRTLEAAYPLASKIRVILDNYVIHKSTMVVAALRGMARIALHFLPPYCPEENKIERKWQDLHANVTRNHTHRTIAQLIQAVRDYLDARFWSYRGFCPR
jgi:transposase